MRINWLAYLALAVALPAYSSTRVAAQTSDAAITNQPVGSALRSEPSYGAQNWYSEQLAGQNAGSGFNSQPPVHDSWQTPYPFQYYPPSASASSFAEGGLFPSGDPQACFCTPPPCYFGSFYLEALILDRQSRLDATNLYFDSTATAIVDTDDFNLETEAGVRVGFLFASPCGNDWMGEYFGIHGYRDTITVSDAVGVTQQFFGQAGGPVPSLTAEYESNLDSFELMIRSRQSSRLAPFAGFRYVQVDENFNSLEDPVNQIGWFSHSDNDLYGFQLGLQALLFDWRRWRMESVFRGGAYYNDVDINVRVNDPGQDYVTKHVSQSHTAFVGDVRVQLLWRLGPHMNFRGGYQALWIEGVALAPNQSNNISFTTNVQSADLSGVFYQGGFAGFDLTW